MQTKFIKLESEQLKYPLHKIAPLDKILFVDIETTGFTAKGSCLYLIGAACFSDGHWYIRQWFAEKYEEEKEILEAFFSFSSSFTHLVHFNGNNFDLPFMQQKCAEYGLPYHFDALEGIDLYRRISPYKFFLNVSNCKQKTLEAFLGINRQDVYNGGELISVYHDYVKNPTDNSLSLLLQHNSDDMRGMLHLTVLLSYHDLFNKPIKAKKVWSNSFQDYHGKERHELLMKLALPEALPKPLSTMCNGCYFSGEEKEGLLKVPIYEEEMKFFYSNYKEYYYLPAEDLAMHKSVSSFVDKEHRIQATAATCYTRKISSYLPQWDILVEPFFKRDYKSRELFFELTDERKQDRKLFGEYAGYILNKMANTY